MSISDQITRLTNAKAAIKQSIINKGVTVSDSALLNEYPALIDSIEAGGEGGNPYYEELFNMITNNNTDYSYLFHSSNKESLDLSNFDTSNATDMSYMFQNCTNLTSLDLSSFNTSNVTNMSYMFYGCYFLTSLDVSSFDTSNVTSMENTFYSCYRLTSLDLSNFDTSNVTNMENTFYNCNNLTSLDVSSFDTSKVTSMKKTFYNCNKLTSLDLSNWDVGSVTSSTGFNSFFSTNMKNLTDFKAPKNIRAPISFTYTYNLTHDSLMSILNNLATVTSTKKLTLGATNLAKLTDEEKAIATNKGWTLA